MTEIKPWKTLSTEVALETPYFNIRKDSCLLPDGTILQDYYVREEAAGVVVFCVTRNNELVLVRQFRQPLDMITLELPSGVVSRHDRTPEEAARRELLEETGYSADQLVPLMTMPQETARTMRTMTVYLGRDGDRIGAAKPERGEIIETVLIPLADVPGLLDRGEVTALGHVAGILLGLKALAKQA